MASARHRWILIVRRFLLLTFACAAPLRAQRTNVPADSIALTAPVGTLPELLSGRVPGLVVSSHDGSTGAGSQVTIRGESPPLLIVDGVRTDNDGGRDNLAVLDHPAPGRFDDLDPAEISSIEVLPGASATALYGPDAGNGVILVKTKHASSKARGFITAEGARVTTPVDLPDNYYAWGHQGGTPVQCLSYLRASGQCTLDSVTHFNPLPSTLTTVYQERIGATVEGTSATQRLFLTGHYLNDPGTLQMPASDAAIYSSKYGFAPARSHTLPNRQQQGDVRGSLGIDLANTTDVDLALGYVSRYQRDPSLGALLASAAVGRGYSQPPLDGWRDSAQRPWHDFADVARENARHVNGGATINWRPSAVWVAHLALGVDAVDQTSGDIGISPPVPQFGPDTTVGYNHTRLTQYTVDAGATLTVGDSSARSATTFGLQYLAEHFRDSTLQFGGIDGSFSQQILNLHGSSQDRSAYAREALTFGNTLVLAGGARYDNQRFRAAHLVSWTLDPSFDMSWAIVGSAADPRLRIRGAMGQTTTLPDARQSPSLAAVALERPGCLPGGFCQPPAPRPERQREWETGFDASLPNDRWTIGFSIYARRNVHQRVPVDTVLIPEAITSDRGVEFTTGARLVDRPTFGWDVALAASQNTNKVLHLSNLTRALGFGMVKAVDGHPIDGVWQIPYTYSDANHDGVIEPSEVTFTSGANFDSYVGPSEPTHLASGSTTLELFQRRLRVSTLFDYRGGYVLPDVLLQDQSFGLGARALNVPGASLADQATAIASRGGSTPVQRVSALRWRELSATVGTPGLHTMQVTLAVRNLRLWSGYHGDPDWIFARTGVAQLPEPRTWLLRVTAGF
jgi:TonB-dependent SusC/RagA subfamily outer membrane receptor